MHPDTLAGLIIFGPPGLLCLFLMFKVRAY